MDEKILNNELQTTFSTGVTEKDAENVWIDKFGVIFSADKKRLLRAPKEINEYSVPEGTEIICDWAFGNCEELISIDLCNSLSAIGCHAFFECLSLVSITIPGNVFDIGTGAFDGCECLQIVYVSSGVKSLGAESFIACSSLESISLPETLSRIKEYAFTGCVSLKSVTIPSSVISIERGVFEGCNCEIISKSDYYKSDGSELYSTQEKKLIYCTTHIAKYCIPDFINIIGEYAFCDCSMLKSIVFPKSVNKIEEGAFSGCESLDNIKLPNSLISIGEKAFSSCDSLKTIFIPESVVEIGNTAFEDCGSLKRIYVPSNTKARFEQLLPGYESRIIESDDTNLSIYSAGYDDDDDDEGYSLKGHRFESKRTKSKE